MGGLPLEFGSMWKFDPPMCEFQDYLFSSFPSDYNQPTPSSPVRIHQLHLGVPQGALGSVRPLLAALSLPPGLLQLPLQLLHTGFQHTTLPVASPTQFSSLRDSFRYECSSGTSKSYTNQCEVPS